MRTAPDAASLAEFRRCYTAANLRRVRWIVAALFFSLLASALAPSFRALTNPYASAEVCFLLAFLYGMMWATMEWALRAQAGDRARERVAAIYYPFGCVTSVVLFYLNHFSPLFWGASLCLATVLILPPRLSLSLLIGFSILFIFVLFDVYGHTARAIYEAVLVILPLPLACYISVTLYKTRRESFLKEKTILRQIGELQAANTEMGDLMAIAAHNLGSPLQGMANLLKAARVKLAQKSDPARIELALEAASHSCDRMIALVQRLVEAHAVECAGNEVQPIATDLVPHFVAAGERAGALAEAKGIALALRLPPSHSLIGLAHPALLGEVLDNLLSNAVKYSHGGSTVTLALSGSDGICRGEIHDHGPGIAEKERPHLFSKFFNGESRPTGGESSTGLGLFIVRKLMTGMGGKAGYEPGTPKGSVFWLEVPGATARED